MFLYLLRSFQLQASTLTDAQAKEQDKLKFFHCLFLTSTRHFSLILGQVFHFFTPQSEFQIPSLPVFPSACCSEANQQNLSLRTPMLSLIPVLDHLQALQ
jgi:hypothetical protein